MGNLAKYDAARSALQAAVNVDEVKDIRDKAAATIAYARQAKDRELLNWATEIRDRAERRAGEMLREIPKAKGELLRGNTVLPRDDTPTLADLGVTKMQSSRWQKVAAIPEDDFEAALLARQDEASKEGAILNANRKKTKKAKKAKKAKAIIEDAAFARELIASGAYSDRYELRVCSCSELLSSGIRPDAVITDPPYPQQFMPVFSELAIACKDNGVPLVAVMSGQSYLPEVMARLCEHLSYRWMLAYLMPGGQAVQQFPSKINTFWKPVLLFGEAREWLGDVFRSDVNDNEKRYHGWGQSESGMLDLVTRITTQGQLICDPFLGGGATAISSLVSGRRFIGCDIDEAAVETTRQRIESMV